MSGYCPSQVPLPVYPYYDEPDEAPVAEPTTEIPCAVLDEVLSHLRVALLQVVESDDQIIIGHIREALCLLETPP